MHHSTWTRNIGVGVGLCVFAGAGVAHAGSITAVGTVQALTDVNQLQGIIGTADYNDGVPNQNLPLDKYTPQGMTFYVGTLASILPGVTTGGSSSNPSYRNNFTYFPQPIAGGGVAEIVYTYYGGAVKFDDNLSVTQFGLTAGRNGNQYLTVWDKNGQMLGQINWVPAADSAFLGVDTMGVPIGMLTYGNDDLWNGASYSIGGSTIMSDTWIWASGAGCTMDAECADEDLCNGDETCVDGQCQAAMQPLDCDDMNVCTDDACDPMQGCQYTNNVAECDDGDACTEMDVCAEGVCGGGVVDCDDMNVCTADSCDMVNGCANDPIDGCCLGDEDCLPGEEMCDLEMNVCEPLAPMTDTDGTTTGDTDTDGTTDGTTSDGTTTDVTATDTATTEMTTDPTTGTTGGETTGGETTGGTSDTGTGTGATDTATGGTTATSTTATATDGTATDDSATTSDSGGVMDEGGCGCRSEGGGDAGGLLALFGLGWLMRRRRAV